MEAKLVTWTSTRLFIDRSMPSERSPSFRNATTNQHVKGLRACDPRLDEIDLAHQLARRLVGQPAGPGELKQSLALGLRADQFEAPLKGIDPAGKITIGTGT